MLLRSAAPEGAAAEGMAPPPPFLGATAGRGGQGRGVLAGRGRVAAQVALSAGDPSGREVVFYQFFRTKKTVGNQCEGYKAMFNSV
jgi:hypothetical protein